MIVPQLLGKLQVGSCYLQGNNSLFYAGSVPGHMMDLLLGVVTKGEEHGGDIVYCMPLCQEWMEV